nr:hypothetical protein [uncultured Mediterranean phage uvMED]
MSRIRANQITNQSADGAPTVQNGLIISGVCTATSFSGSGANLTSLPAQATIANNADNRIITGGSGVNLNGESTITYDNPTLEINTDTSAYAGLTLNGNTGGLIQFEDNEVTKWSIYGDHALNFYNNANSTSRLYINSSGQMGLGVTPNTNWPTNNDFKALQIGTGACVFGRGSGDEDRGGIAVNWYSTGSANKYIGNGNAARIYLADGNIYFANAGANSSGANAAMTMTDRMVINSTGSVSIGNNPTVHSDTIFHVEKSSGETNVKFEGNDTMGARLSLHNNNTSASANNQLAFCDAGGQSTSTIIGYNTDQTNNYGELVFATRSAQGTPPAERLRINSNGYITTPSNVAFEVTTNGGQNLTNQTVEKVQFNNVVNQRGVSFDTSNYRFTAPVSGYYHFDLFIYTYYTRFVECDSRVNGGSTGSKVYRLTTYNGPSDQNPCPLTGSWMQYLAANDYVEQYIFVTTSHGTHRYIYGDTNRKPTWWAGYLVG